MPAGNYPIKVEQGADFALAFTYYPDGQDSAPQDFSGWTGEAQVRQAATDTTPLLSFDVGLDAVGVVEVTASAAETAAATAGRGIWDLEVTRTSDGFVIRLLEGRCEISPQVTQ